MTTLPNYTPFYGGGQVQNPANVLSTVGAPSNKLTEDRLGTIKIDNAGAAGYMLVSKSGGVDTWAFIAGSGTGVTSIAADSGTATPALGVITLSGGSTGLTTSASGSTVNLTGTLNVAHGGTGAATLTNHGVLVGAGTSAVSGLTAGSNGQVLLGSSGANPAFGTLTTSTGIAYTTGAHALAINIASGGYNVNAASTGVSLVAQNSYTVTQAAQTSFALPATAAVGDTFLIASALGNTSGWIITQGASQEIWANTNHTTNGATGTLAGAIHTSVVLMCTVANVEFIVIGGSGLTGLTFT